MRKNIKIVLVALITFILDQFIKFIITTNLSIADTINVIKNFFRITYVENSGAAFSIFENSRVFLILLSILILSFIVYYITKRKKDSKFEFIIYGTLIGGILGNLIDRIRFGYVLDFNFGSYSFPVFNLADIFIVISGIILMIKIMMEE